MDVSENGVYPKIRLTGKRTTNLQIIINRWILRYLTESDRQTPSFQRCPWCGFRLLQQMGHVAGGRIGSARDGGQVANVLQDVPWGINGFNCEKQLEKAETDVNGF